MVERIYLLVGVRTVRSALVEVGSVAELVAQTLSTDLEVFVKSPTAVAAVSDQYE